MDSERKSEESGVAISDTTSLSSSVAAVQSTYSSSDDAGARDVKVRQGVRISILVANDSEDEDVCEGGFKGFDSVSAPTNEEHSTRYPRHKRVTKIIADV
ncbi:hypothetical protein PR048_012669 [Dryococelus australis]|uniref:Uncharacterized protein n=1 Tax=Dryococelus australis TaxID=614101 RepID=A0ABQ9HQ09_9NEOP|nr:hypothetical protein PR048_012669 [Dryococelus australis]